LKRQEAKMMEHILSLVKEHGVKIIDLKFIDVPGLWQHFSVPVSELSDSLFQDGVGFDGSSIRGFQQIHESDMLLVPDPATAFIDPFTSIPTLSFICNVKDPVTGEFFSRDPRYVARKAEEYLKSLGIADVSYWGPELEYYIFNDIRFDQDTHFGFYFIDSREGIWNSGREENPNLGYKMKYKEGYFPAPPMDTLQDVRSEIVLALQKCGVESEVHHHEVGGAGQGEIDMKYASLTRMADNVMLYKYVVKNVARRHGLTATFMPKPIFMDNGSGMHTHISLWKGDRNLFFDPEGYALISETALYFIGGLLKHTPALLAFCAPTTNSYRRLVPGYEAPINLVYSQRNRSACVRIPVYHRDPRTKRVEYRPPDPSCNPYLAFAAMLMAGLDGIQNRIHPGEPLDKDVYHLPPEEAARVKSTPGSLEEVLRALEEDMEFLLKGDVFTPDLISTWMELKRKEIDAVRLRPHPYEFFLYYEL